MGEVGFWLEKLFVGVEVGWILGRLRVVCEVFDCFILLWCGEEYGVGVLGSNGGAGRRTHAKGGAAGPEHGARGGGGRVSVVKGLPGNTAEEDLAGRVEWTPEAGVTAGLGVGGLSHEGGF